MQDPHALLQNVKPIELTNSILFFDHWEDPPEFYTMSGAGRKELYNRYLPQSVKATETNYWIWFGNYQTGKLQPRYKGKAVTSLLHCTMICPTNGNRLRALGSVTKSDVNPFKYKLGETFTRHALIQEYKRNAVNVTFDEAHNQGVASLAPEELARFNAQVATAKNDIKNMFYKHVFDTKKEMRESLLYLAHSEFVIDEALKQTANDYPWREPVTEPPASAQSIQA